MIWKSIETAAPPRRVWEVIVSPRAIKRWMLVEPQLDEAGPLGLGSKVVWVDEAGKPYLTGTVIAFEPAKSLVVELADVSWERPARPREVTYAFALAPQGRATRLSFSLGDLSIDREAKSWHDAYQRSRELEAIKELAEKA